MNFPGGPGNGGYAGCAQQWINVINGIIVRKVKNKFIILAKIRPDAVAMENATAPRKKIPRDLGVRKTSAWVLQPTVKPRKIVAVSMMAD